MFPDYERRILGTFPVEMREVDGTKQFIGRAVVYDSLSQPICGMFIERFARGAFDTHLATNPDIICTVDHDTGRLLGRTASGTLKLSPDDKGIAVACSQPDTTVGRDLAVLIGRRDIQGMSFIFESINDEWSYDEANATRVRTVTAARIHEVSFVTFPAYPDTEADMRSARSLAERFPITNDVLRERLRLAELEN